jgi:hypothetical protein
MKRATNKNDMWVDGSIDNKQWHGLRRTMGNIDKDNKYYNKMCPYSLSDFIGFE